MAARKKKPSQTQRTGRPPVLTTRPPKGAWMKQIGKNLKQLRPPPGIGGKR